MISVRLRGGSSPAQPGRPRPSGRDLHSQGILRGTPFPAFLERLSPAPGPAPRLPSSECDHHDFAPAAIFWLSFPCVSLCAGSHLSRYLKGVGISGDPCVSAGELPTQPVITFKDCFSGSWFYSPPMRLVPRPTPSLPVAPDQH